MNGETDMFPLLNELIIDNTVRYFHFSGNSATSFLNVVSHFVRQWNQTVCEVIELNRIADCC